MVDQLDARVFHTLDGAEIHYRVRKGRDPWLLLHALGCDGTMWEGVAARLPDDVGLVIPDLRGHGASTLGWRAPEIDLWAEDVVRIAAREELERPAVAGISMGGYTALALAARFPDAARAFAFISTHAAVDDPGTRLRRADGLATLRRSGWREYAKGLIPALLGAGRDDADANRDFLLRMFERAGDAGLTAALFALANRPARKAILPALPCPSVVIVGDRDALVPVERAREIASTAPGSSLEVLPGVGHMSAIEDPAAVAEAMSGL